MDDYFKSTTTFPQTLSNNTSTDFTTIDYYNDEKKQQQQQQDFLSDEFLEYSTIIVFVALNGTVGVFGIIFNIVNIIVFCKQGFSDSINVSLFSLTLADLGSLLSTMLQSIGYGLWIVNVFEFINFRHVQYATVAYSKGMFDRISSFILAYISFERCLCIIVPLKIRSILTKRVTLTVIGFIYTSIMGSFATTFYSVGLSVQYDTSLNRTVLSLRYRHGQESKDIEDRFILVISFYQIIAFVLVIVFTAVLVFKMSSKNKWRQKTLTAGQLENMSARDKKVIKMVIVISTTFAICFTPTVTQLVAMYAFSNYGVYSLHRNLYIFMWSVCTFVTNVGASLNIFFYYRMSSRYASILDAIFPCRLFKNPDEGKKKVTT